MNTLKRYFYGIIAGLILVTSPAIAATETSQPDEAECPSPGEGSIVLNADGNYTLTHDGCVTIWEPATKIDPVVTGQMTFNPKTDTISYDYQIHNTGKGQQPIAGMRLDGSNACFNIRAPESWRGQAATGSIKGRGFNVGISRMVGPYGVDRLKGVVPGAQLGGIGFDNTDLPGVGNVYLWGATSKDERPAFHNEKLDLEFNEIQLKNYVPRLAPVPMIPVASPFNAAAVLTAIQQHLDKDLVGLWLVQPAFAGQLDSLFQKAINSVQGHNLSGARDTIRELQTLIERAQGGKAKTIDPLAVQVLVFDLKVVDQRLGN